MPLNDTNWSAAPSMVGARGWCRPMRIIALWVLIGLGGAGLMNAEFRALTHERANAQSARAHWGFCVAWGVVGGPLSAAAAILFSGGGAYGWSLDWHPVQQETDDAA